jgi:uncharacterized YccA/Bax inhibitor family protein
MISQGPAVRHPAPFRIGFATVLIFLLALTIWLLADFPLSTTPLVPTYAELGVAVGFAMGWVSMLWLFFELLRRDPGRREGAAT